MFRISSYEANAKDGHSMGEFTDLLLHSLYKVWVPIIKVKIFLFISYLTNFFRYH